MAVEDFVAVGEQAGGGFGFAVLRGVGEQGLHAAVEVGRDVHDERGRHVGVERGVEQLVGSVGRDGFFHLAQAGEEAGFETQLRGDGMVGMAGVPIGQDDDLGFEAADDAHESHAQGQAVVEARVGHAQILTKGQAEDGGGLAGLGEAQLGRAA